MMFQSELHIPRDRVAVLIGTKGATKKQIEGKTRTKVKVSRIGDVFVQGMDNLDVFTCVNVVRAIGRGFNPHVALELLKEENAFELISIPEFTRKSKKRAARMKARLIGTEGLARKTIEKLTHTHVVIYGKTVGIIGHIGDVYVAKGAVEKLLKGGKHGTAYRYIRDRKKKSHAFA